MITSIIELFEKNQLKDKFPTYQDQLSLGMKSQVDPWLASTLDIYHI